MKPKLNLTKMKDLRVIREVCDCVVIFTRKSNFQDGFIEACVAHSNPAFATAREEILTEARVKREKFFSEVSQNAG